MGKLLRVLIVEDSPDDLLLLVRNIERGGFDVTYERVLDPQAYRLALECGVWDIIISDYSLPNFSGLQALEIYKQMGLAIPFIIVSGAIGEDVAVEAMKAGAHDYVMKGNFNRLVPAIERELEEARMRVQQKCAEQALEESEAKYRTLFDHGAVPIIFVNEDCTIGLVNNEFEKMLGFSRGEIENKKKWTEFIARKDDLERMKEYHRMRRIDPASVPRAYESQVLCKNGEAKDVIITVVVIPGTSQSLASFLDITERKRFEKALGDSEMYYRSIFENSLSPIITVDADYTIQKVNSAFCVLFGYESKEVVGNKRLLGLTHPDDVAKSREYFDRLKSGEIKDYMVEKRYIARSGKVIEAIVYVNALYGFDGVFCGATGLIVDITARRIAENELLISNERFRKAFVNTPVVMSISTLDDGRFIDVNSTFCETYGISKEEAVGKTSRELDLFVDYRQREIVKERILSGASVRNMEVRLKSRTKGERIGLFSAEKTELEGVSCLLVIINDITESKRSERSLKLTQFAVDHAADAIIWVAKDGSIIFANGALCALTGFSDTELLSMRVMDIDVMSDVPKHDEFWENSRKKGSVSFETTIRAKDGRLIDCEVTAAHVSYEGEEYIFGFLRDITARKQALKELNDSRERFEKAFNNSPALMGISVLETGVYVDVNRVFLDVLGFSRDEVIGKTSKELGVFTDYRERLRIADILKKDGTVRNVEVGIRSRVKGERIGLFSAELIDVAGEKCLLSIFNDVTEIKMAERALRQNQEKFEKAFQNSPGLMSISTLEDGRYIEVNDVFLDAIGFSREEVIGKTSKELGIFVDYGQMEGMRKILSEQGVVRNIEMRYKTKNKGERVGLLSAEFLEIDGVECLLSVGTDITELKHTEDQLKQSEDRFRRLAENANALIYRMSLSDGKYEYISPAVQEMTGYTPQEFYNDSSLITRIVHPDFKDFFQAEMDNIRNGKVPLEYEFKIIHRSGEERWINQRNVLISGEDGRPVAIEGIGTDITARKYAENALQESRRRLETLISNLSGIVYRCRNDRDWTMEFISDGCLGLTGYPAEDFIGNARLSYTQVVHPDDLQPMRDATNDALANRMPFKYVYRIITKSGEMRWMWEQGRGVWAEDGGLIALEGFIADITFVKKAEEALKAEEYRLKTLLTLNQMGDELTKEITDFALEEAVRMSQSSLGYLAFVNEQETVLTMHSWSKDAMALCGVKDGQHVYYIEKTGFWGEAIRQRRTIITNDYAAANEFKRGYPEGHVPIKRHMNIPVFDGGRIVLLIGVANKTEPYTEADVRQLTLLMQGMWQLIQRKHSQDMLRASLREKDLLLKEINHRVNNNLQLISNLLAMQRKYIRDKDALTVFTESQNRIRSIALVHEKLYLTKGFATIDLKEYIKELAHNVVYSFVSEKGRIALEVKVGDITMNIERAITCGLVLNELISNTLKHAFPEGRQGRISVSFMNDAGGNILMVYSDDGVGIPESIEPRKASSLGLRLIYTLVEKQLDGSIELIPGKGAEYRITFHQTEADFPLEARKNAA